MVLDGQVYVAIDLVLLCFRPVSSAFVLEKRGKHVRTAVEDLSVITVKICEIERCDSILCMHFSTDIEHLILQFGTYPGHAFKIWNC